MADTIVYEDVTNSSDDDSTHSTTYLAFRSDTTVDSMATADLKFSSSTQTSFIPKKNITSISTVITNSAVSNSIDTTSDTIFNNSKVMAQQNLPVNDDNSVLFIILSSSVAVVIAFLIIVVIFIVVRKKRNQAKSDKFSFNPELVKLVNSADDYNLTQLKSMTEKLTKNDDECQKYLSKKIGTTSDDETISKKGLTRLVRNCRFPEIECIKKSQVEKQLHVNKLFDYKNDPLFLAMAPNENEIEMFWELIVHQKIGVVMWFGQVVKPGRNQSADFMIAYVPLQPKMTQQYGKYKIVNISVNTSAELVEYKVAVTVPNDSKFVSLEIYFLHNDKLSDLGVTITSYKFSKITDIVIRRHKEAAFVHKLPAVMFQCTTGIGDSASFCAIYIGNQMMAHRNKVNVVGIIKYIRKQRHGAFTLIKNSYKHLQIIYAALEQREDLNAIITSRSTSSIEVITERSEQEEQKVSSKYSKNSFLMDSGYGIRKENVTKKITI